MKKSEKVFKIAEELIDGLTEEESLLIMYKNRGERTGVFSIDGDSIDLQGFLLKESSLNYSESGKETISDIKNFIINACLLICEDYPKARKSVMQQLKEQNK